jgi:predicted double-glycine peptidase
VRLARELNLNSFLLENADLSLIEEALLRNEVVFVTWWDEDAGHYSLVKSITPNHVVLMDPWEARADKDRILSIEEFYLHCSARGRKMIRAF